MAGSADFQEIEGKFLDIDPKAIAKKLESLGAVREFERTFRRYVFDFPDRRLDNQSSWLRVRDEGDKVTMTYKQRLGVKDGKSDDGMHEIEVVVSDFEHTAKLLQAIGMEVKFYEENKRTLYRLGDVEFAIDEWPLLPPYLEIETDDWDKIKQAAEKLDLKPDDMVIYSTMQIYKTHGIDEKEYKFLTFDRQEKW